MIKSLFKILPFLLVPMFFLSCEKEVTTSPPVEEEYYPFGYYYISSEPEGAKIYLNKRNSGKITPDSLVWLDDTTQSVRLVLPLYRDTVFSITPEDSVRKNIHIEYLKNPLMKGSIQCISLPDSAEILLNDSATGRVSPDTIRGLIPGEYKVTFKYPVHRDGVEVVTVRSNEISGNVITLEDTSVWVTFTTDNSPLTDNAIACLVTDSHDNLWIGTLQNGLLKFDGSNWTIYNTTNSPLPSNEIITSAYDEFLDDVWIGTYSGLAVIDGENWTIYNTNNSGLPDDRVMTVEFDYRLGRKWIGTQDGLAVFDNVEWVVYNSSNSALTGNFITEIDINVFGEIWIGTSRHGIWRYFGEFKKITNYYWLPQYGYPGSTISSFASDQINGVTYIGFYPEQPNGPGQGGLASFNGSSFSNKYPGQPSKTLEAITVSDEGVKWVSTADGLVRFVTWNDRTVYRTEYTGLISNYIKDVAIDGRGIVWIGTFNGGLTKYKGEMKP